MPSLATSVRRHVKRASPTATVTEYNTSPFCERVIVSTLADEYETVLEVLRSKMRDEIYVTGYSRGKRTAQFIVEWQVT